MAELLASTSDIQKHLDRVNVQVDDAISDEWQVEAHNIVKSQLASTFSRITLFGWDSPDNTPPLIRGIAGRLIAAYIYRKIYSRETGGSVPEYAASIYQEALGMLQEIRSGGLTVLDADGFPIEEDDEDPVPGFYPNESAPGPFFTMDRNI